MTERIVLIFFLALGVAACGGGEAESGRETVVAAFYPLAFAAGEIGGDAVEVTNLTPPGAEPHDVELSARDVARVRSADLVLYLGGGFQPALERAVAGADVRAVDLLEGIELRPRESGEHPDEHAGEDEAEHALDAHVWLDPLRYAQLAERIGEELDRAAEAAAFAERLRRLDRDFARGLEHCERRAVVTSHAAFGHLTARYGLEQIAITGLSPEAEPTARELERVVDEVREQGATTVFFETLVSPRLARTVAREAGARTAVLDPLEGLTQEQLEQGADYFSVMRANLAALRVALGCS